MSGQKRIVQIVIGVLSLVLGVILLIVPDESLPIVAAILSISLIAYGVRMLYFYFSMGRYMVSGRMSLYIGVIVLDFGMFLITLLDFPKLYIALYLVGIHAFAGVVSIMRALEAKKFKAASWKMSFLSGVVNIVIAVLSVAFLKSTSIIVILYSIGLIYSAVVRIVTAFRKTAIIYIQ